MPKPQTKQDLIALANSQYDKLWALINSMSEADQERDFIFDKKAAGKEAHWTRDNNLRDVLIHLYEWQQLLLNWVENNLKGVPKQFLLEPYNWKMYGEMNVEFWKKHQNTSYDKSKQMLKNSHQKVMRLIDSFSDKELFSKKYFAWVGGSTLGQYCISTTSSHYDWAIKKIKAQQKALAAQ